MVIFVLTNCHNVKLGIELVPEHRHWNPLLLSPLSYECHVVIIASITNIRTSCVDNLLYLPMVSGTWSSIVIQMMIMLKMMVIMIVMMVIMIIMITLDMMMISMVTMTTVLIL